MAPTLCSRCGDAVEEGCDPRDELAELDVLLERIKLKRYDLKRKINQHHSPIVHLLPPDVMSTIFEFCVPDFADRQLLQKDFSFSLSLGAICSYWRDIAWSTPSLWSSLVVRVVNKHDPHIIAGVAQEWLARSGQLPLYIRIFAHINETASALVHIINRYSTRWSDLDLSIPRGCYQYFHAIDNHAPTLKSIQLYSLNDGMSFFLKVQLTCPRLERASLERFPMNRSNIQWDNLRHLTLQSMSIIDSFLILRETPRLVSCKVLGTGEYRWQNTGALVLTSLRSLHLQTSLAENFLNNIIAPHLEDLSLPDYYYNPSMEVITAFLKRSACSLRSFSMAFFGLPPHFERFTKFFRSINTLTISIMASEDYTSPEDYDLWNILQLVAKVLSSQSTSLQEELLPNLKILKYTGILRLPAGNLDALANTLPPADNAVHGPLHLFRLDLYPMTRIPKKMIS